MRRCAKISEGRYEEARRAGRTQFSWRGRAAGTLVLAVHGNGQNAGLARRDWAPLERAGAQVETVQSSVVDCTGRFRWEYDGENYRQTADAARIVQDAGYERQVWAGFSAGCDMLLRTLLYTGLSCDTLALQSPWTPLLEKDCAAVCRALAKKNVEVHLFCGTQDSDCIEMAQMLYGALHSAGGRVHLTLQTGLRHQFPPQMGREYLRLVTRP